MQQFSDFLLIAHPEHIPTCIDAFLYMTGNAVTEVIFSDIRISLNPPQLIRAGLA
jgi:hypothetical protein